MGTPEVTIGNEAEERWEQIGGWIHHLNLLLQGFVQHRLQEHLAKLPRFL